MFKKTAVLFALLMLAITGAVAQGGEPIKIGAIFDLSGETSDVGTPYAEGVAAYVENLNQNGGIGGRPIELLGADSGYDVGTAEQIYAQLAAEGVVAVMGWGTEESLALASQTARDQIPFVSASSSELLNDPSGFAPYNFLVAPTYGDQLIVMMFHMLELWESDGNSAADMRVAIFHHDSDFGLDPISSGEHFAREAGIGGVLAIPMSSRANDFTAELLQADDYGITHIVIQNLPRPAAQLAQNIVDFFGEIPFGSVGCLNWCANEQFVSFAGSAAENVLGAIPFAPTSVRVSGQDEPSAYLSARGESLEGATLHFTQGWATMGIVADAIQITVNSGLDVTGPNVRAALETMRFVDTGDLLTPVTFSPDDHRATRALAIYAVQGGRWTQSSDVIDLR